jgi:hypothetical protein
VELIAGYKQSFIWRSLSENKMDEITMKEQGERKLKEREELKRR